MDQPSPAVDPPAYSSAAADPPPPSTQRSLEDTRTLILSNAQIIRPKVKLEAPILLVTGRTRTHNTTTPQAGSSRSVTRNVSITPDPVIEASSNGDSRKASNAAPEHLDAAFEQASSQNKHYAALVIRSGGQIHIVLRGKSQHSVEAALEWLLNRTEMLVTETLDRHAMQMKSGCCLTCDGMLTGAPIDKTSLAGWRQGP